MELKSCLEILNDNVEKKPYLIIFVHGIGGSKDSFKNDNGKYFHEYFHDSILKICDICCFSYESKWLSSKFFTLLSETSYLNHKHNKTIDEITTTLFSQHKELSHEYVSINFICHSMGGLIVKTMINKDDYIKNNDNIPFYITLGTPHTGSKLANLIPIIHKQKSYLKTNSPELVKTNTHFEYQRNKVKRYYYYGDNDVIVPKETAVPEYELKSFSDSDICQEITGNHTEICKPDSSPEHILLIKSINRTIKDFLPKKSTLDISIIEEFSSYLKCFTENKKDLDELIENYSQLNNNYMLVSPKGIGKSYLLKLFSKVYENNTIYINLEEGFKHNIEIILKNLNSRKKIFIVDGINIDLINKNANYKNDISIFLHELEKLKDLECRVIFSFDSEVYTLEYINRLFSEFYYIHNILEKMNFIIFSRINKFNQPLLLEALKKYKQIKTENINKILNIINKGAFSKIDTFIIDLINKNIDCNVFNFQTILLNKVNLILSENHEDSSSIPKEVYDFYIKENMISSSQPLLIIINQHLYLRYALIAEYIINGSENEDLEYIYPYEINSLCKDIIQSLNKRNRKNLLNKLIHSFHKNNFRAQTNYSYLLGRMEEPECKDFLFKQYKNIRSIVQNYSDKDNDEYKDILMLERTIIISLINSGNINLSNEYIKILIRDVNCNNLNRGFHLEYYGDILYRPNDFMENEDSLTSCDRTFDLLYNKVDAGHEKKYPMFEIELFTILSIIQNRLSMDSKNEKLFINKINRLINLLNILKFKNFHFDSDFLNYYVLLLSEYLIRYKDNNLIDYTYLLKDIYNFGDVPRKGWVKRNVVNPENVPTHILKSYYLALMFLPNNLDKKLDYSSVDKEVYSKQLILDMILIHDLGESVIGDFTPEEKDIKLIEEEKVMIKFSLYGTFIDFANTSSIYTNYHLFANPSGNINSLIANDIDMIDSIMQSKFYHDDDKVKYKTNNNNEKDRNNIHKEFIDYFNDRIKTRIGKELLDKLNLHYKDDPK